MVLGAEHVPLADGPPDLLLKRFSEAALTEDCAFVFSLVVGGVSFAYAACSEIQEIYLGKIVPNRM